MGDPLAWQITQKLLFFLVQLGKTYYKSSYAAFLPLGLGLDPACPGETAGNL